MNYVFLAMVAVMCLTVPCCSTRKKNNTAKDSETTIDDDDIIKEYDSAEEDLEEFETNSTNDDGDTKSRGGSRRQGRLWILTPPPPNWWKIKTASKQSITSSTASWWKKKQRRYRTTKSTYYLSRSRQLNSRWSSSSWFNRGLYPRTWQRSPVNFFSDTSELEKSNTGSVQSNNKIVTDSTPTTKRSAQMTELTSASLSSRKIPHQSEASVFTQLPATSAQTLLPISSVMSNQLTKPTTQSPMSQDFSLTLTLRSTSASIPMSEESERVIDLASTLRETKRSTINTDLQTTLSVSRKTSLSSAGLTRMSSTSSTANLLTANVSTTTTSTKTVAPPTQNRIPTTSPTRSSSRQDAISTKRPPTINSTTISIVSPGPTSVKTKTVSKSASAKSSTNVVISITPMLEKPVSDFSSNLLTSNETTTKASSNLSTSREGRFDNEISSIRSTTDRNEKQSNSSRKVSARINISSTAKVPERTTFIPITSSILSSGGSQSVISIQTINPSMKATAGQIEVRASTRSMPSTRVSPLKTKQQRISTTNLPSSKPPPVKATVPSELPTVMPLPKYGHLAVRQHQVTTQWPVFIDSRTEPTLNKSMSAVHDIPSTVPVDTTPHDQVDWCGNMPSMCGDNSVCTNSLTGFKCVCLDGFFRTSVDGRHVCHPITITSTVCSTHEDCPENAVCTEGTCECRRGYQAKELSCVDIDECSGTNGLCDAGSLCINMPGGWMCTFSAL